MIVDIHNHTLFGVDDGAKDMETSIAMLRIAKQQGISHIIMTPHYRHGMFDYPLVLVNEHFNDLKRETEKIGINVYLGCEYHVDSGMLDALRSGMVHALADGDYVLSEYSHVSPFSIMVNKTRELISNGFTPVIAHVERYQCIQSDPKLCWDLQEMGALIQINADSILGNDGRALKSVTKKLMKHDCVDIVASDAHGINHRANNMAECFEYVYKKYGQDTAKRLFVTNPGRVLE